MSFDDFRNQCLAAKIGSILNHVVGESVTRRINQHMYDRFRWDFTGWENREDADRRKINVMISYSLKYNQCKTFIETGTYFGATTRIMSKFFDKAYTIEIDDWLHRNASQRLLNYKNVVCLRGDSKFLIPRILAYADGTVLYWLDAHYSGGVTSHGDMITPIEYELTSILNHSHAKDSVVLIDDARCFGMDIGYPTIERVREITKEVFDMEVKDDIIRLTPKVSQ